MMCLQVMRTPTHANRSIKSKEVTLPLYSLFAILGGALPEKLIPALAGRNVRCILFDLGDTLWSRKDMAVWERVEDAANVRAVAILRKCVTSPSLPNVNEVTLGKRLRESVDERLRNSIRQEPGLERHGGLPIVQALQKWAIEGVVTGSSKASF